MYNSPECSWDMLMLHSDLCSKVCFGMFPPYAFIDSGLLVTGYYLGAVFELELWSDLELMEEFESLFNGRYWKVSNEEE